jgi:hypothetical protein
MLMSWSHPKILINGSVVELRSGLLKFPGDFNVLIILRTTALKAHRLGGF